MRTWTLIMAGLVAASAVLTASMLPEAQPKAPAQEGKQAGPPVAGDDQEPAREVRRRIEVLGGRDVQIGVTIRDLEGDQARDAGGAIVAEVREDSPAAKAGIKEGDIVVEFDGERVRSARHLSRIVGESAAGRTVKAVVQRDGRRVDLQVTPEAGMAFFDGGFKWRPAPNRDFAMEAPGFSFDGPALRDRLESHGWHGDLEGFDFLVPGPGRGRLGIGIQNLTPQLAEYFGTKDGVLVTSVEPDSAAAKAGLRAGDVITAVGETPISSPGDLTRAVRRAEDGTDLPVTYTRDKKSATTKARLEPRQPERSRKPGQPI